MSSSAGSPGSSSTASAPESKATSSSSSSSSSGSSSNSAPPPSSNSNSNNNNNNNNNGNGTSNIGGSGNNSTSNTNNDNSGNNTNNNNANNNNSGGGKSNNDNNKNNDGKNNSSPASPPPSSSSPPPASPPPSNSKNGSNSPSPSPSPPSPPPSSPPPSSPPPSSPSPSSPPPSSPPPSSPNSNQSPPQKSSPSSSPPAQSSPPTSSPPNQSSSQPSPPPPNAATTPPGDPKWSPPPPQATPVVNPPPGAKVPPNAIPPPVDPGASTPKPTPVAPPTPSNSTGGKAENSTSGNSSGGSHSSGSSFTQTTILGATVAGVFVIALIAIIFVVRRKKKKVDVYPPHYIPPPANFTEKSGGQSGGAGGTVDPFYGSQTQQMSPSEGSHGSRRGHMFHATGSQDSGGIGGPKSFFTYEELMEITNGFSRDNILGEGGFGCVYKGWLPDGKVVAVKQLKAGSGQGEREFRAEVEIISRVHHRHLVSLVGYCISEQHRLLIYEFVPNKTLEHHLHGRELPVLEWSKRVKIAVGAAKGLAYLHEDCHPKIIHRDIKSANILLDDSFEAQVADFGLAKLNDSTQTHVSTRVMGTFGYLAPEYASSGKLTDRSDVFSFGVVLLELITGRKPVDPTQPLGEESLVEWARPVLVRALETGDISEVVDPRLEKHYVEGEVFRMIEAATACVRHSAPKRPRMVQVVRALDSEGDMSDLSNGVRYGQSTMYDSGQYNHDIMKFRKMALGCDDSSEFSADYTSGSLVVPTSQTSSECTSGESETRAMTHAASKSSYGHHF